MRRVLLADVVLEARPGFASGADLPGGVLQVRMNNVSRQGDLDFAKQRRVPVNGRIERFLLRTNDVLFNATNSPDLVGKTTLFREIGEPVVFSNHFLRLRVDARQIDAAYLTRWMQWQHTRGTFGAMSQQWVNQAAVRTDRLLSMEIPLPPLDEQRRIVCVLDVAATLRQRQSLVTELTLSLVDAGFLDAFGDPVRNTGRWPKRAITDVGMVVTGNTPPRSNPTNYGGYLGWVKNDDIRADRLYVMRPAESLSEVGASRGRIVAPGSVLVTCISGSPSAIGRVAMARETVAFNQQINAVVPDDVDARFLCAQLRLLRAVLRHASTGGMKGLISKSSLKQVSLIVPPKAAQASFGRLFDAVAAQLARCETRSARLDVLFTTLQRRAFSGTL